MDDLSHLFSAYFYEAWDEYEYKTWEAAVDDFARRSPERVVGATNALERLLAEEEEIERQTKERHDTPHFRDGQD